MDRNAFEQHVADEYGAVGERPWLSHPDYVVFRHARNEKWFAVVMRIPKKTVGLSGEGEINVVNLKNDPESVEFFAGTRGIFPAYHMNKTHWLTVALDDSVDDDLVKALTERSFDLTAPKIKLLKSK